MKRIISYYKPYTLKVIIILIVKITGTILELSIPFLLSFMVDEVIPNKELKEIIFFGLIMILAAVLSFVCNIKANQTSAWVAKNITYRLRKELFIKIMSLSSAQIDDVTIPTLVSRMSTDTYNVHQMVAMIFRIGVRAPVLLLGGLIATLFLDPVLTLVIAGTFPLIIIVLIVISKLSIPLFTSVQKATDGLILTLREDMAGIKVIKALVKEDYEKERFDKANKEVINFELKSNLIMTVLNPIINFILNIGLIIVLIIGAIRVSRGIILVGKVLSISIFFSMIVMALVSINRIITIISKAYASSKRIDYIFDLGLDLQIKEIEDTSDHFIEFRNVNFSYLKVNNNLNNISFSLEKNESLGIIGSTGSGKSTIINLLLRLYDVDSGNIFIDGKDIRTYDDNILKSYFGTVLQYDTLFSDTVYHNVDFYRGIKKDDVITTLHDTLADFVFDKKEGLDFKISAHGTNLSGGQKQRLLLARALASKPPIIILDDSSSALDYKTDMLIRKNIKEKYHSTLVMVSNRISAIKNCDKIIVLDDGKIDNIGTHEELLKTSPIYQEIYFSSLGGDADE